MQSKMDSATMRKRGWSIQSDQSERHADDLTAEEKKELLESFPVHEDTEQDRGEPERKRRRQKADEPEANKNETLVEVAKQRLSKWAARLFDPNRPRGLVEPPAVIPLNDEFLTAFGRREKDHDEKMGRIVEIPQGIGDASSDEEDLFAEDRVPEGKQESVEERKVSLFVTL
jgi:hypothetical protein